jgi:hypothetical protein
MSNKKNIDRLFQEKFKDFEVAPSDAMWNRISEDLPNKKKRRRVIPIWWQIGGVAAAIALLLTVGVSVFNSDDTNNNLPIVDTEQNNNTNEANVNPSSIDKQDELKAVENHDLQVSETSDDVESNLNEEKTLKNNSSNKQTPSNQITAPNKAQLKTSTAVANTVKEEEKNSKSDQKRTVLTAITNKDNNTKVADNTKSATSDSKKSDNKDGAIIKPSEIKSVIKKTVEANSTAVAENTKTNNSESSNTENTDTNSEDTQNTIVEDPEKQSIEDAIAENTIEKEKEDEQNRWSIAPNVAPVYFGSLGEGSPINDQFVMNAKSSDINMSYGIAGSYAVSKRLKVRAGINRVNLNHVTTNVVAFTGTEALMRGESTQMANIKYKNHDHSISFMDAKKYNSISKAEMFNTKIAGEIDQRFGFIEVPLELEYRLLDKKFGINVIGGFSTFFLSNNEIYADIDGASTLIGEANNINSTSFSANFGLGLDYSLSKQWNINLEPQFKYQLNTFNNTSGNFRPFFIGVYTGLSFKF